MGPRVYIRQYQPPEEQRNAVEDVKFGALKTSDIQVPVYVIKVINQCWQSTWKQMNVWTTDLPS